MMNENWKDIAGYGGVYQVSNLGRIKRRFLKHEKKLTAFLRGGYYCVNLCKNNHIKYYVHRAVAVAFIPNPDRLPVVNHIDKNKLNNAAYNLEWTTSRENKVHALLGSDLTSSYPGVSWDSNSRKWAAKIYIKPKNLHLGLFRSEEDAAIAYTAALAQHGIINKYATKH